jgi:hypothetical protein
MNRTEQIKGIVSIIIIVAIIAGYCFLYLGSAKIENIEINDKWVKYKNNGAKYLVSTNKGVYEITDSLLFGTWSSSDKYANLKVGEKYSVKSAGWRIPFFSSYKNIVEIR